MDLSGGCLCFGWVVGLGLDAVDAVMRFLIFIVFHLIDFHFVEKTDRSIYQIVLETFSNPGYTIFYILSIGVVAVHVDHGFWSLLQTLGINNLDCMPVLRIISSATSLFMGIGFGSIPVFISLIS